MFQTISRPWPVPGCPCAKCRDAVKAPERFCEECGYTMALHLSGLVRRLPGGCGGPTEAEAREAYGR